MSIDIQQPRPYDIVTDEIHIGGTAGGAFEATYSYRIHEGHDEVTGHVMAGDGIGGHGQFHIGVDVSGAAFTLPRLFVEVFHVSARDGEELDSVTVPVLLGRLIVPGYTAYLEYVIQPGDTLWGIAADHYGSGTRYPRLVEANPLTITDPDVIRAGDILRIPRA